MTRLIILLLSLMLTGCVSMQRYSQMEQDMLLYKEEALMLDSLRAENIDLQEELDAVNWEIRQANRALESLNGLHANLNANYEGLVNRCNQERADLEQALYLSGLEIATLRNRVDDMERANRRNDEQQNDQYDTSATEINYPPVSGQMQSERTGLVATYEQSSFGVQPNVPAGDIQQQLGTMRVRLTELTRVLQTELNGFQEADMIITNEEGKVVISLFSPVVHPAGEQRLVNICRRVSTIIQRYEDFMVSVEGYSPYVMEYANDLSKSTAQAIRVSSMLNAYGTDPIILAVLGYVTPTGEDELYYQTTDSSRLQRVDIVFTPFWFDLFEP